MRHLQTHAPVIKPAVSIGRFGHSEDDESGTRVPAAVSQSAPQLTAPILRPDNVEVWTNARFPVSGS